MARSEALQRGTVATLIVRLEEDKVRQARDFETRELEWEYREVELERIIHNMERQQAEVAGAASQFETAVGALPDKNLPIAEQLDIAVTTIKSNMKSMLDAKAQEAFFKKVTSLVPTKYIF